MILVIGSVLARADAADAVARLSVEHCRRSRAEPGCVSHAVHRDVEEPLRFVFVERWADRAALDKHFAVPASGAFIRELGALLAERPSMAVHEVADG